MKVVVKEVEKKREIQCGDIVCLEGDHLYLIIEEQGKYVAKDFDGMVGAVGRHETLERLNKALERHLVKHYSKHDYNLVLEMKKK